MGKTNMQFQMLQYGNQNTWIHYNFYLFIKSNPHTSKTYVHCYDHKPTHGLTYTWTKFYMHKHKHCQTGSHKTHNHHNHIHGQRHTATITSTTHGTNHGQTREPLGSCSTNLRPPWSWFHTIPIPYGFTQTNQTHTHHPRPKITTHHQHPIRDPYIGSPKSRVRVRVSREFEREGEAIDAVREKCRERERQGTALPSQNPPPPVAVKSGGGECKRSSSSYSWPWSFGERKWD